MAYEIAEAVISALAVRCCCAARRLAARAPLCALPAAPRSHAPPPRRPPQGELTPSCVNAPMMAPEVLKELQPYVGLGRWAGPRRGAAS